MSSIPRRRRFSRWTGRAGLRSSTRMAGVPFGYGPDELVGKQLEVLLPESVRHTHAGYREDHFSNPKVRPMGPGMDLAGIRRDGTDFPVEVSLSYIETRGGPMAIAFVNDISTRIQAENDIRRLNASLEERVKERTAQLEAANKDMESFSYSVSHDLRAPPRGIDGWSLALLEDYGGQLDQRAPKYLGRVRSETQRMGFPIDDLLQLSKVTRADMEQATADLSAIASRIAGGLTEANAGRPIHFSIEPGLTARCDARLVEIALTNLLENAVKFTGPKPEAWIEFGATQRESERVFQ